VNHLAPVYPLVYLLMASGGLGGRYFDVYRSMILVNGCSGFPQTMEAAHSGFILKSEDRETDMRNWRLSKGVLEKDVEL